MAKFIITEAEGGRRDFPLDKERITIGRHADNDICLNNKAVSGHHAVVITLLGDSFLEDLNSTNGTQVNGRQIAKHALSPGDVVGIGRNTLKYEARGVAADNGDFEMTVVARPGQASAPVPSRPKAPPPPIPPAAVAAAPTPVKPVVGRLRVTSGPNMGKELELSKALTTIGRPGVQVAAITRRVDGFYIVHAGESKAGARPLVNKIEVDTQARKLNDGDIVELVGTQMTFHQDS